MVEDEQQPAENRVALGDADFKQQLTAIIPPLRAFSRGLCSNRSMADDMVQEALLKGWAARGSYAAGTNFRAWMFMILRNHYYTTIRRESRMVAWDPEASERIMVTAPTQESGIDLADVERALQKISPEQREVLLLVGANSMSYEEAAAVMGCALGTIKSRLARGRTALLALVEGDDDGNATAERPAQTGKLLPRAANKSR